MPDWRVKKSVHRVSFVMGRLQYNIIAFLLLIQIILQGAATVSSREAPLYVFMGYVLDCNGVPIANATVSVYSLCSNINSTSTTNSSGYYAVIVSGGPGVGIEEGEIFAIECNWDEMLGGKLAVVNLSPGSKAYSWVNITVGKPDYVRVCLGNYTGHAITKIGLFIGETYTLSLGAFNKTIGYLWDLPSIWELKNCTQNCVNYAILDNGTHLLLFASAPCKFTLHSYTLDKKMWDKVDVEALYPSVDSIILRMNGDDVVEVSMGTFSIVRVQVVAENTTHHLLWSLENFTATSSCSIISVHMHKSNITIASGLLGGRAEVNVLYAEKSKVLTVLVRGITLAHILLILSPLLIIAFLIVKRIKGKNQIKGNM